MSQESEHRENNKRREAEVAESWGYEEKERKLVGGHRVRGESNLHCESSLVGTLRGPTRPSLSEHCVKGQGCHSNVIILYT